MKSRYLIAVLIFILLATIKTWVVFYLNETLLCVLADILIVFFGSRNFKVSDYSKTVSVFAIMAVLICTRGNINAYISAIINISPFILFCFLRREIRMSFLLSFNKVFAIIILVSTICWVLFLLGVPMPNSYITYGERYEFDNYYTFLNFHHTEGIISFFPRFCSIIIEPGDLACILCLLIFLDKYRFNKWYNIVYLIALILTFSLAGLFMFTIGLLPNIINSSRKNRIRALVSIVIITGIASFAIRASEDSVVYQMIGQRLIEDEDTGQISGYNRNSAGFSEFFDNVFWKSDKVLFGYGDDIQYGGVDMRMFIAKFGIVSLLVYVLFLFVSYVKKHSKYGLWFFILFFMIFYKGYSMLFYSGMLMLLISGLDRCYVDKELQTDLWPSKNWLK